MLLTIFLVSLLSYLSGSIPFGFLVAKLVAGVDLRKEGSGNVGATNVGRILGTKWGIFVLLLDALKGAIPVYLLPLMMAGEETGSYVHLSVLSAVFAIVGHMFPLWLGFRGGKGVATALGVVIVLSPWATLVAASTFLILFGLFRIVSFASILAVSSFGVAELIREGDAAFNSEYYSLSLFSIVAPALIIWQHRSNIMRLLKGEEPKYQSQAQKKNHSEENQSGEASN